MTDHSEQTNKPHAEAWDSSRLKADPHADPEKASRVQRMFGAIAERYDLNNRLHSLGRDQAWRKRAVRMSMLNPSDDVLDVACGTGDLTEAFAKAGARTVQGVDFTPQMLDLARVKAQKRKRRSGAAAPEYHQGDAMDLQFSDASFDVLSIAFGIRNVTHPERAVAEFHRVLRPGGRVVILEFCEPGFAPMRLFNGFYCKRIMPLTASLIARDRSGAYHYLPRSVETFSDPAELSSLLASNGFEDLQQKKLTMGICAITVGHKQS
ncbi:MAG: bifunctional demethylmenaquinone methyltransferase/2-methoxy-6-polyprenyl-1,4-benzoquinol methylase UbiE [Phycisphaerae bacterium]|nr:bifunctional demethylmenaquinone methyltransferase/2-methoxy-6-polyprenyl-1,4-benzoquinol methylase UbiE [Phycisphaerae bacterium]